MKQSVIKRQNRTAKAIHLPIVEKIKVPSIKQEVAVEEELQPIAEVVETTETDSSETAVSEVGAEQAETTGKKKASRKRQKDESNKE